MASHLRPAKVVVLPVIPVDRRIGAASPSWPRPDIHRKNPLRRIVARKIRMLEFHYYQPYLQYTETLECGHILVSMPILPEQYRARRRRCAECAALRQHASQPGERA